MADGITIRLPRPGRVVMHGVIVVLVLGVILAAFAYWSRREAAARSAGAGKGASSAAAPPLEVRVIEVQPRTIPLAPTYLGRTEASQTVDIRARVNGFLEKRAFEEGGKVKLGQLLFQIDPRPFEAALQVAKARLAGAQARREGARRQVERLEQAFAGHAASAAELDQARTDELVAAADIQLDRATTVQAELDLGYTRIESPVDGVIGRSSRDVGSYVEAGDKGLLATAQKVDPMYVLFSVSEQEILRWQGWIASGQVRVPETTLIPISLTLSDGSTFSRALPNGGREPITGHINFVGVQVDQTTGTALVRGDVPNPDGKLRPGQFVTVTSRGMERLNTILVPQSAVVQSPTGASVYVVAGEPGAARAARRPVSLGEWYGTDWIVTEGLKAGDRVVVDRVMQLRPDLPVVPTTAPAAAAPTEDAPRVGGPSGSAAAPATGAAKDTPKGAAGAPGAGGSK